MSSSVDETVERTVTTDTRHWKYRLQEHSEIPPIITFLGIFTFFGFAADSFLSGASLGNVLTSGPHRGGADEHHDPEPEP